MFWPGVAEEKVVWAVAWEIRQAVALWAAVVAVGPGDNTALRLLEPAE